MWCVCVEWAVDDKYTKLIIIDRIEWMQRQGVDAVRMSHVLRNC